MGGLGLEQSEGAHMRWGRSEVMSDAAPSRTPPLRAGAHGSPVTRRIARWGLPIVALLLLFAGAGPVAAQVDGLDVVSDTTFTPVPDDGVVRVVATFVLTNEKPNSQSGYSTIQYYYDRFPLLLPDAAEDVTAVVDGSRASVTLEPYEDDAKAVVATIILPRSIWYLQSATIKMSYVLRGGAARDPGAWVRVNPAYVAFPVWACCDGGQTSVRIEMPTGFVTEFNGSQSLEQLSEDPQVYLAADIADPAQFFTMTYGRSDDGLVEATTQVGDIDITIAGWPDDPEWLTFARAEVESGLPTLVSLTGLPADVPNLRLVETITPYLYGYAGWFDTSTNVIEVGEDLNPQVILHELSHIWFNQERFTQRWMNEGFAEAFSNGALAVSGRPVARPSTPDLDDAGAVPLNDWDVPTGVSEEEAAAAEAYGYNASWYVVDALAREIGLDGLSAVMAAMQNDELSYAAADGRSIEDRPGSLKDWRRLLDLVEQRAGSLTAEQLFRTYVIAPDGDLLLADRRAALDRWSQLVDATGSWEAPIGIRVLLSRWRFDDVGAFVDRSEDVLAGRNEVAAAAAALDLDRPGDVELAYENAEAAADLDGVLQGLEAQRRALATVADTAAAVGQDFGFWASWGLRGTDLDAEYADVRVAFERNDFVAVASEAAEVRQLIGDAPGDAKAFWLRVTSAATAALILLACLVWGVRRTRRRESRPQALHLAPVAPRDPAADPAQERAVQYLLEDEGA